MDMFTWWNGSIRPMLFSKRENPIAFSAMVTVTSTIYFWRNWPSASPRSNSQIVS